MSERIMRLHRRVTAKYGQRAETQQKTALFILLLIPFLKTAYIDTIPLADTLFNGARALSMVIVVILYIGKRRRADVRTGLLVLFVLCILFSTMLNIGVSATIRSAYFYSLCVGTYLLIDLFSESPKIVIASLFYVGEVLVYLNLLSMLVAPNGLYVYELLGYYHNWILGYKNVFLPFFICFAIAAFLRVNYTGRRIRSVLLIVAMLASLLLAKSSTSFIVMGIFVIGMLLVRGNFKLVFNPYLLFFIMVAVFFIMVVLSSSEVVSGAIATVSNRDVSFSGRTIIWSSALEAIAQQPWFGWGKLSDTTHIELLNHPDATTCHNFYLEILLSGGVLTLFVFCLFLFLLFKKVKSFEFTYSAKVFAVALFSVGIAFMTEAYSSPLIFLVFSLAANVDKFASIETGVEKTPSRCQFKRKKHLI